MNAYIENTAPGQYGAGDKFLGIAVPVLRKIERLARSKSLCERRIAIIATFATIKERNFQPTLAIAERLVDDDHDLIHKAVGWMLREVGKRDANAERAFLDRHAATMPRTALRYAIEKFGETERKKCMAME